MANNETYTCSPSEVCLLDSDSELLIPTPWSDKSKNEKRAKRWREEFEWKRSLFEINFTFGINAFDLYKGTGVMKDTVSQKNMCEEEVPLNNNIGKQIGDFVDMSSEAVEQRMDANALDEIDGAKGEKVPNHVVKKVMQLVPVILSPRYFSFGRYLNELHVTWAHLEKKRTRLQTNTKTLEDLCSQSLETASQAIHDAVTPHPVTASHISRRRQPAPTQTQI
ncbi:hypothetical protein Tco_1436052 [Tanacetum coccineum]